MAQHNNVGFLEGLGVSPVDEQDRVTAERDSLLNKVEAARRAQGRTAGRSVAGLLGGVTSIIRNKSFKGVGTAISQAQRTATDRDVAQASGITVEQLQGRREIRQLKGVGTEGTFESRIALANKIASIANRSGDTEVMGRALKRATDLRTEKTEFDKLKASADKAKSEADLSDVVDGYLDGSPVTGTAGVDADGGKGLWIADEKGVSTFYKWGERLLRDDGEALTSSELLNKFVKTSETKALRTLVGLSAQHLRKSRRVMSMLVDANKIGNLPETISTAGQFTTWIDKTTRNIGAIIGLVGKSVLPQDRKRTSDYMGWKGWQGVALDATNAIWDNFQLPEFARQSAAAADLYRSQILDMAYLAARMAEPSNRGLSDKDIQAALVRIAGDSANPQTILTRFAEHIVDGAVNLQVMLSTHYGAYTGVSNDDVDRHFGGEALINYRNDLKEMGDQFGFTSDRNGRITFQDPIDATQQPIPDLQAKIDSGEITLLGADGIPEGADMLNDILADESEIESTLFETQ